MLEAVDHNYQEDQTRPNKDCAKASRFYITMSSSHIIGYVDPLVASAGSQLAVKVSCSKATYTSDVLRLGPSFDHPDAPPISNQLIDAIPHGVHQGKLQFSRPGSFARIEFWEGSSLQDADSLSIRFWCQATLPKEAGHEQFLFSSVDHNTSSGFACLLDDASNLCIRVGGRSKIQESRFSAKLVRHQWYNLHITIDCSSRKIKLRAQTKRKDIGESSVLLEEEQKLNEAPELTSDKPLTIASDSLDCQLFNSPVQSASFNGKIEDFKLERISSGSSDILLHIDFSVLISTDQIQDISSNNHRGELINAPARAVTGHDWDASQNDWTHASYGYSAIHFHDDDLDDAAWETDFELCLTEELKSGCYGVLIDDGSSSDIIPFFVRPDPNALEAPSVALIIPTFTYAGKQLHLNKNRTQFLIFSVRE